jgi:glycosyltransferase involved in cell wall biosynthesis
MKILILAPYPLGKAPSQRFRFEHFLKFIEENAIVWSFQSFVSDKGWQILYEKGNIASKILAALSGFLRRWAILTRLSRYDYIFIHRELAPFGPPIFEWLIAKVFRKKIIYDFDDAIWLADQKNENPLWKMVKWRSKVASICKWSWKVTAGNNYLADYAKNHCDQVVLFPTVVDTAIHKQQTKPNTQYPIPNTQYPTIGWTGSHSTLFYLDGLLPVLQALEKVVDFEFVVIANRNPELPLKHFRFIPWNKDTEIEDLRLLDIGVMPLEDNEWAKGKCGFKLIQYLALGIPAVAAPVGVNDQIVLDGETGFLADNPETWKSKLLLLLQNPELRDKLGQAGRRLIEDQFSVKSQESRFLELFE